MYDLNSAFDNARLVNDYHGRAQAVHMARTETDYITQGEHVQNTRPLAQLTSEELQEINLNTTRDALPPPVFAAMMHDMAYYHAEYFRKQHARI